MSDQVDPTLPIKAYACPRCSSELASTFHDNPADGFGYFVCGTIAATENGSCAPVIGAECRLRQIENECRNLHAIVLEIAAIPALQMRSGGLQRLRTAVANFMGGPFASKINHLVRDSKEPENAQETEHR